MRWLLVALAFVTGCTDGVEPRADVPRVAVRIQPVSGDPIVISAEIADEPAEQRRGLMFRASLPAQQGMIFVFDDRGEHDFWMKNTRIPLDLISIREGRVVDVRRLEPCRTETCPTTTTPPIDAALEVNAGTAARAGIGPGALVEADGLLDG